MKMKKTYSDTERLNWLSKHITADDVLLELGPNGSLSLAEKTYEYVSLRRAIDKYIMLEDQWP